MNSPKTIFFVRQIMLWASCIGLFASSYLLVVYITGLPIACGLVHGCDIVRGSAWAHPLGIPMPLPGVLFYTAIIFLLGARVFVQDEHGRLIGRLLMIGSTVGFLFSLFLTGVEIFDLHAYCIWCIVSAITSTMLFAVCLLDKPIPSSAEQSLAGMKWFFGSLVIFLIAAGIGMVYLLRM